MIRFIKKLEERLFGDKGELSSLCGSIYIEIIKLVDYWKHYKRWDSKRGKFIVGDNTPHWLGLLSDLIYRLKDINNRYQHIFLAVDERRNLPVSKNLLIRLEKIRENDPVNYIRKCWKELRNQNKYDIVKHQLNEEELIRFIKYICLMLSGQVSVNDSNGIEKIDQMKVDYRRENRLGRNDIRAILKKAFIDYFGPNDYIYYD